MKRGIGSSFKGLVGIALAFGLAAPSLAQTGDSIDIRLRPPSGSSWRIEERSTSSAVQWYGYDDQKIDKIDQRKIEIAVESRLSISDAEEAGNYRRDLNITKFRSSKTQYFKNGPPNTFVADSENLTAADLTEAARKALADLKALKLTLVLSPEGDIVSYNTPPKNSFSEGAVSRMRTALHLAQLA